MGKRRRPIIANFYPKSRKRAKNKATKKKEDFGKKRKNWVEQLREWIKSSSEAEIEKKCQNYSELKKAVEKIGTNRLLLNRKVQMDFSEPWRFAAGAPPAG